MKDIFELMGQEPIDITFLDGVVTHKLPTEAEVKALINDPEVIDKTADQIIDIMFDEPDVDIEQLKKLGVYLEAEDIGKF